MNEQHHIRKEKQFKNFEWIDLSSIQLHDLELITKKYVLNYHLIKDSLEKGHLPKYEKGENFEFFIFRAYTSDVNLNIDEVGEISNKIAFFIFEKKILTIHRASFDFLENDFNENISRDEFFLTLVSNMINSFTEPINMLVDKITEIEKTIFLKDYRNVLLEELYYIKSQTRILKKILSISQTVIDQVGINFEGIHAYQDIKDTLLNMLTTNESSLENANQLMTTYLSISEQKNNEIVRLLTIFSAFFLPLTFIVGVYGMNFHFMPEINWIHGYYYALLLMLVVVILIYIWFKRKKIL